MNIFRSFEVQTEAKEEDVAWKGPSYVNKWDVEMHLGIFEKHILDFFDPYIIKLIKK